MIQNLYNAFEGKIIRKVNIVTLDPFWYSTWCKYGAKSYKKNRN
jgi:hypothetical protein